MKELIGRKFKGLFISKDKMTLKFGNEFSLTAYGDCCSESWFDHVNTSWASGELKIVAAEEVQLGKVLPSRQESDEIYGLKLQVEDERGCLSEISIEMRNSSNGYYGGSFELSETVGQSEDYEPVESF